MSGVLYPDLARSFALGSQLRVQEEERGIDKEVNELVPAAMKGDQAAIENIARKRPNVAMGITGMLDKMDAGRRAKVKEASQWTAQAAMGILSLPEAERPAAYQAALADGQRLGYQIDMPPQYDRAVDGRLRQILNQTRTFENYWKDKQEGFDLVPSGGGGGAAPPATGGGGVNPYNIGNVRPVGGGPNSGFQQPASLDDGIRLAVNNVKAYPAKFNNGQPMTLVQIGQRWAPKGDGANDPNQWAINVASIGGLDPNQPLDLNDPMIAAKFARGVHGAEHGANKVLPPERYAQAITGGAAPPGIAQGDTAPPADASGTPIPTSDGGSVPREVMRMITPNLPPGTNLGRDRKTGLFKVQEGKFVVYDDNKNPVGLADIPKTQGADKGLFGDSLTGRAVNALRTLNPDTQEYAAAYAILSKPQVVPDGAGGFTTIQPMNLSMFAKPTFAGGAFVEPPPVGGAAPAPTQAGGVTIQNIPGKGKPLDNSARDDLVKASGGVLELTELVKSFDTSFGGYMYGPLGEADNARKRNLPASLGGGDEKGQAQWWQRYQQFANLERNKLFGAALTPGEAAEFNKAMVNPGMQPDQITTNLARQRDIATKALSRIVNSLVVSGYNPQAIEAATGISVGELPSPMGSVPQAVAPPAATPSPPAAPKAGDMVDGYVFRGGNPADPNSWSKVQ